MSDYPEASLKIVAQQGHDTFSAEGRESLVLRLYEEWQAKEDKLSEQSLQLVKELGLGDGRTSVLPNYNKAKLQ